MVSWKNYVSIVAMMAALFFMFMFPQIVKEYDDDYAVNAYAIEVSPFGAEDAWQMAEKGTEDANRDEILFIGPVDTELEFVVRQWCVYTKRNYDRCRNLADAEGRIGKETKLILLDAKNLQLDQNMYDLYSALNRKVPVVFCNLPESEVLLKSEGLRKILNITSIIEEHIKAKGIELFSDFFLGEGVIYEATTEELEKRQDFNLEMPWFELMGGTKVYMRGIMDDYIVKSEYFPPLIWRGNFNETRIFVVSGDYMDSLAGLGILNAFLYELDSYELHPIVNAQNIIIANFPNFSAENAEELYERYSRTPQQIFRDIMWPGVVALTKANEIKLTCCFNPQYDYLEVNEPQREEVEFYLKQLKECEAEAGWSLSYKGGNPYRKVLYSDLKFYESLESDYQYQVLYVDTNQIDSIESSLRTELSMIKTVSGECELREPLLDFLSEDVTLQGITNHAEKHTFYDDFEQRGVQTALGYRNVLLDLQDAVWPESEKDEWQILYNEMASNVSSYWSGKSGLAQTVLSESDVRVRQFLCMDYQDIREGNTIYLEVENLDKEAYFLLRMHDEKISHMEGGTYKKVEENAYLLCIKEAHVEIVLENVSLREQIKE